MPGPAPKPAAERRRRNAPMANTVKLPAEGRSGPAPAWPFASDEPSQWADLWATPQAVAWDRLGWIRVVARYALMLDSVESENPSVPMLAEVRQLEDRLGLTPMSMLRLRWEVAVDEVGEQRAAVTAPGPKRRLKAL